VVQDPKVDLCIGITGSLTSSPRGAAAQWIVSAWTTGGNVPDAIVRLQASPASVTPQFSFGCGSNDGTASCDLGAMDAKSAQRQLQAQVNVPATSTVPSVTLTVIGSAAHLPTDPQANATVAITGPAVPAATTSPLPVGSLPSIPTATPTLTPGGNAAGLFPTINPSPSGSGSSSSSKAATRAVADTSALPEGSSVVGAQLVGLGALVVAFVLAITRMTIRRRPSMATGSPAQSGSTGIPSGTPDAQPGTPDQNKDSSAGSGASANPTPEP